MASINPLSYTDDFADNKKPILTDLRSALDSIQDYINDQLTLNTNQFVQDAFPSGYAFNADGLKTFSAGIDLFNKQISDDTYTGGDIAIAVTGAWTDVDTANAKISFTPDLLSGHFCVNAQFAVKILTSNAVNEADVSFRITDGSTTSLYVANVKLKSGVSGSEHVVPVSISHQFASLTGAAPVTVTLQYLITTLTAATVEVLANTTSPIALQEEKI